LKCDPFGLLPSEACAPDQKVLYVEDFQDGQAQEWPFISAGINGDMPNGWTVIDESGNKILKLANAPSPGNDELENHVFDNFIWRAKFKIIGSDANMFFMWRITHPEQNTRKTHVGRLWDGCQSLDGAFPGQPGKPDGDEYGRERRQT